MRALQLSDGCMLQTCQTLRKVAGDRVHGKALLDWLIFKQVHHFRLGKAVYLACRLRFALRLGCSAAELGTATLTSKTG